MKSEIMTGLLLPFLGTSLGAGGVFFMKRELGKSVQRALTGFAAGVMTAASVWSLLIPAMDMSGERGRLSFLPAVIGFWAGVLFLMLLDSVIPHLHMNADKAEGRPGVQRAERQTPLGGKAAHRRNADQGQGRDGKAPHGDRHALADAPEFVHARLAGGKDDGARAEKQRVLGQRVEDDL